MEDVANVSAWWVVVAVVITVLVCSACASCVTNGQLGEDGRNAVRTITRLEEQLASADRRLEEITERAEGLEGDISTFEQRFRVYVDCVREMRRILEQYEREAAGQGNPPAKADDSPDSGGNNGNSG